MIEDSLRATQEALEDSQSRLDREKNITADTLSKSVGLDMDIATVKGEVRGEADETVREDYRC